MNTWGGEQVAVQNGMHGKPPMMQNMMPPPLVPGAQMQFTPPVGNISQPQFIGSAQCGNITAEIIAIEGSPPKKKSNGQASTKYHEPRIHPHNHSTPPRDRDHRNWINRDRQTNWENNNGMKPQPVLQTHNNIMMPGLLLPISNIIPPLQTPLMNQQIDMTKMQQMIPGLVPKMLLINQKMQMNNQRICFNKGAILPPPPNIVMPQKRERPPGCRTLIVGGLPTGITNDSVTEIFQLFGTVEEVKPIGQEIWQVRFDNPDSIEPSFILSGCRIKLHGQMDCEALSLFIDYAVNRDDQIEYEKNTGNHNYLPSPTVEPFNDNTLSIVTGHIKSDARFSEAAPVLVAWLEHGECNKKNSNTFYGLIQAKAEDTIPEVFTMDILLEATTGRMQIEFKVTMTVSEVQHVCSHTGVKGRPHALAEDIDNIREEFNVLFEEDEKTTVSMDKYRKVKAENDKLQIELEGYKNEAQLAKTEAEHRLEKFKACFIAEQALQLSKKLSGLPLPSPSIPDVNLDSSKPQTPTPNDVTSSATVNASEAKLISLLSAFLVVHPLGATLDYLVSYIKSMHSNVTQVSVLDVLQKYTDVFRCKTNGVNTSIEPTWFFKIYDSVKMT
ncbi:hypothetical protein HW555_000492 [Spodoptera exigua]|uniref:RRM domain-containing protein n=1 Tax=Spodoptera exigua TaxID=7107 RepID=A0A835GUK5_SPOEX|nr:hypothetical protein HW555_000492 [Spodoptera exigua]